MELSEDLYEILKSHINSESYTISEDIPEDVLCVLKNEGFVCLPNEDDEFVSKCQFITQSVQHDKSTLNLVIVPTLNCNFNCSYCFENNKRASRMSDSTIDNLISFIKSFEHVKEISLTWYGGEPLLALPVIEKLLYLITDKIGIKIKKHSIITNGYLFSEKAIQLFQKFPLDRIQITLDGTKDRHNHVRALKVNNNPTYDKIRAKIGRAHV